MASLSHPLRAEEGSPNPNQSVRRKPAPAPPSHDPPNPPTGTASSSHGSKQSSAQHLNTFQDHQQPEYLPPPAYHPVTDNSLRHSSPPYHNDAVLVQPELPLRGRQGRNEYSSRPRPPLPSAVMGASPSAPVGIPSVPSAHMQSHLNTMGPPPVPSAHVQSQMPPPSRQPNLNYMGPALSPSSHTSSPVQHPSGPSHLTKPRPRQAVDGLPQPPSFQSSPRSSSQPSPMAGSRLHKPTPSQSDHLSPVSRSPAGSPSGSPIIHSRERSNSLAPPLVYLAGGSNRVVSSPTNSSSSANAYHSDHSGGSPDGRQDKRRSWMFGGGRSRASSKGEANHDGQPTWICTSRGNVPYNAQLLLSGERVPELWTEIADTYVYLFPPSSGKGPSFKIPSMAIASSAQLMAMAFNTGRQRARSFDGRHSLSVEDARLALNLRNLNTPPATPRGTPTDNTPDGSGESINSLGETQQKEGHILYPFASHHSTQGGHQNTQSDLNHVVSARNVFAFLTGQPLVATRHAPTPFKILCNVASELRRLGFSNVDGSTFGEAASSVFDFYVADLNLADVSGSREKTIEALVLGERMRSMSLYNEAFAHAVGKYDSTRSLGLPVWSMISENTRTRLERAHTDLVRRKFLIQCRLTDCEFPSLFAGIAASTSSEESKVVNFKAWRSSFFATRKFFLSYYKSQFGNWPPKASSKKNAFSESGFNRLVLQLLYTDLCDLYDLLVDRQNPTTRSLSTEEVPEAKEGTMCITALRKMLGEYDRSEPPVQPPVPFDVPLIPTIATIDANHQRHSPQVQDEANNRRLKEHEIILLLTKAKNLNSQKPTEFLRAFQEFQSKEARSSTAQELADQRYGQWLFLYVVLEALPMLVIDAPDCRHSSSVEYFLCLGSQGSPPWTEEGPQMSFYRIGDTGTTVALPAGAIENSPEGIYQRSHCWKQSLIWEHQLLADDESRVSVEQFSRSIDAQLSSSDGMMSPLQEPAPPFASQSSRPTSIGSAASVETGSLLSPSDERKPRARSRDDKRRSLAFPLQQLPISHGMPQPRVSPPASTGSAGSYLGARDASPAGQPGADSGQTFDDILGSMEKDDKRKRRSFFRG